MPTQDLDPIDARFAEQKTSTRALSDTILEVRKIARENRRTLAGHGTTLTRVEALVDKHGEAFDVLTADVQDLRMRYVVTESRLSELKSGQADMNTRMSVLEETSVAHTGTLDRHGEMLEQHGEMLTDVLSRLPVLELQGAKHGEMLTDVLSRLPVLEQQGAKHGEMLTEILDRQGPLLAEILDRLPPRQ